MTHFKALHFNSNLNMRGSQFKGYDKPFLRSCIVSSWLLCLCRCFCYLIAQTYGCVGRTDKFWNGGIFEKDASMETLARKMPTNLYITWKCTCNFWRLLKKGYLQGKIAKYCKSVQTSHLYLYTFFHFDLPSRRQQQNW